MNERISHVSDRHLEHQHLHPDRHAIRDLLALLRIGSSSLVGDLLPRGGTGSSPSFILPSLKGNTACWRNLYHERSQAENRLHE